MNLVEKWRSEGHRLMADARSYSDSESYNLGSGVCQCADDLESACTPRPPKAEWFGEAPGKWDCWMLRLTTNWFLIRGAKTIKQGRQIYDEMSDDFFSMDSIAECVPVTREGFPAPVGWSVVGG